MDSKHDVLFLGNNVFVRDELWIVFGPLLVAFDIIAEYDDTNQVADLGKFENLWHMYQAHGSLYYQNAPN